ncbi:MAG: CGNR zinc finger domain-containing protein [Mycobacterium sp.]
MTTPFGDEETKPAPGRLAEVQALINTRDVETGADLLTDIDSAQRWLTDNGLATGVVTRPDIVAVVAVREALRALILENGGGPTPGEDELHGLRAVMARSAAHATLGADGMVRVEPAADTVDGRLLSLLLVVRDAQADGSWSRLKACGNPDCRWAFYDRSRNHGGTWCDMTGCGNKLKNRDFRARRRRSGGGVPDQGGGQRAHPVE